MNRRAASFDDLVRRYRTEILGYLVRLLGNRADAQDACQDALVRAHRAFPRLAPGSNARAWLYRIATNCARDTARSRSQATARNAAVDPEALHDPRLLSADDRERRRRVVRAVEALPPRQRAALVLRQFQDLGYADIATILGGSATAARANVYQALKRLRATLGGDA